MPEEVRITIFILSCVVLGLTFLLWWLIPPFRRLYLRHDYKKLYYRHIYRMAKDYDYYLVNNISIDIGNGKSLNIDHIIGGDKYLYLVMDFYFEGAVKSQSGDQYAYFYPKSGEKLEIPNPTAALSHVTERFSLSTSISTNSLIGIALFNNDCYLIDKGEKGDSIRKANLKELPKMIATYEKENIGSFRKQSLWKTIQDLHDLKGEEDGKK